MSFFEKPILRVRTGSVASLCRGAETVLMPRRKPARIAVPAPRACKWFAGPKWPGASETESGVWTSPVGRWRCQSERGGSIHRWTVWRAWIRESLSITSQEMVAPMAFADLPVSKPDAWVGKCARTDELMRSNPAIGGHLADKNACLAIGNMDHQAPGETSV